MKGVITAEQIVCEVLFRDSSQRCKGLVSGARTLFNHCRANDDFP